MDLDKIILKYALQNALKFNGKANPGAVIGKVFSEDPKLKSKAKELSKKVMEVIKEVSKLSLEEQEAKLQKLAPELLKPKEKKERSHEIKDIPNAKKGKIVMRIAPSPSGPLHIGHAYVISLNSELCRKYNGQFIVRIEDTNPANIYEPSYGMIPKDCEWVTKNNIAKVIIQSDRLGIYYDYADKLIDMGKGYVCTCEQDHFKELIFEKKACPCRKLPKEEQSKRFAKMFAEYKPGEAVLRCKTDVKHKNPAMRDFPLMRINDHIHPRQGDKFRVWPLMNFSVFVDDVELGVTHPLRGKDHMDNAKRQDYLYEYFDKPKPTTIFVGRINFEGLPMSASKTKEAILEGKYEDWSDIRLPFLPALKRRGYQPEAFIKYALDVGMTQNDKTVSGEEFFKALNHFNKEVLDAKSNRYFFIPNPKKIKIKDAPEKKVEMELHPDYPKRGKRKFETNDEFYVADDDLKAFKTGELIRLMDCLNFVKKGKEYVLDSLEYEKYKAAEKKHIIHWLPISDKLVEVEVRMPDNTFVSGLAEPLVNKLKIGDICQLERFGFCRLDSKGKKLRFWFAHR